VVVHFFRTQRVVAAGVTSTEPAGYRYADRGGSWLMVAVRPPASWYVAE
jgi:hypothetical protein